MDDPLLDEWLTSDAAPGAAAAVAEPPADTEVPQADVSALPTLVDALSLEPAAEPADSSVESGDAGPDRPGPARLQRFVVFTVEKSQFGVLESFVTEVARIEAITPVPRVPAWVRGITNLRGDIVSVVDVRRLLGLDAAPSHTGLLLVVRLLDEELSLGLFVDAVEQIASVPADAVRQPGSPIEGPLAAFLDGICQVGDRFVAVLNLDKLLRSSEIRQFEDRREE